MVNAPSSCLCLVRTETGLARLPVGPLPSGAAPWTFHFLFHEPPSVWRCFCMTWCLPAHVGGGKTHTHVACLKHTDSNQEGVNHTHTHTHQYISENRTLFVPPAWSSWCSRLSAVAGVTLQTFFSVVVCIALVTHSSSSAAASTAGLQLTHNRPLSPPTHLLFSSSLLLLLTHPPPPNPPSSSPSSPSLSTTPSGSDTQQSICRCTSFSFQYDNITLTFNHLLPPRLVLLVSVTPPTKRKAELWVSDQRVAPLNKLLTA